MISEEVLRQAAQEAGMVLMAGLPQETVCHHVFSPEFEKKMKHLLRKTDHPVVHAILTRAAGFLLALLVTGTVWLSVDVQAREAFLDWLRQIRDTHFSYAFSGEATRITEPQNYRPTDLPEGWTEIDSWTDGSGATIVYLSDSGQIGYFNVLKPGDAVLAVGDSKTPEPAVVNSHPAEFYPGLSEEENSSLVWEMDELLFSLSAQLQKLELVQIAESVKIAK